MKRWISQWYAKVPSDENTYRYVAFIGIDPESKPGESDVTVCGTASWFVQHTVEPGLIVIDAGEYEDPWIETPASPAWQPDCALASVPSTIARAVANAQMPKRAATAFIAAYYVVASPAD